ncbi:MAG: hypothetical protein J6L60_05675 [Bacteroidaceae bacterium]|nr:hypothetical protein [Bacteroidaceae bacterium]
MELYKDKNIEKSIRLRQEGKDCLSWIENFGLHLFDEKCMPRVSFNDGEKNEILVLRINKVQNIIYAYYCFFQTDSKGFSRFCVNKAESVDAAGLKDLMDRAKWEEDSTKNYWKEIFCGGKAHNVDETTLKRQETKTSPYYEMNMMEYIECIQKEIQKLLEKLCIPANENISKVLITEQYALAFPLKYALGRIFPNAKRTVYGCIQKIEEKSWKQNAAHFHISGKLLHSGLNTTPQMTISNVLSLREKGVTFTLPLSKGENGEYCLPTTSVIDNSELKWNELNKGDIEPDYTVGNLAFKRVQLSAFADGFQHVYILTSNNIFDVFSPNNVIPKGNSPQTNDTFKPILSQKEQNHEDQQIEKPLDSQPNETGNERLSTKCESIHSAMNEALNGTREFLEKIASEYLQKAYPNSIWKGKYEEALKGNKNEEDSYTYKTWKDEGVVEFLNFFKFLCYYEKDIKNYGEKRAYWWRSFSEVSSAVKFLIIVRNFTIHRYKNVVGIGYTHIFKAFTDMTTIASVFDNKELKMRVEKCQSVFENKYDSELKEHWKNDTTLQSIYEKFEGKRREYM